MKVLRRVTLVPALCLVACGGSSPPPAETATTETVTCPAGQHYERGYCLMDAAPTGTSTTPQKPLDERPAPSAEPSANTPPPSSEPAPPPAATAAPSAANLAAPVDVSMAASAAPIIQYLSAAQIPAGAHSLGTPFAGQFAEGQVLEQRVQLTAGKCYTVVAAGIPPIEEVNLALYPATVAGHGPDAWAADKDKGPQAVLGRKTDCFKATDAQKDAVLVLSVEKGKGVAAAQVFEK